MLEHVRCRYGTSRLVGKCCKGVNALCHGEKRVPVTSMEGSNAMKFHGPGLLFLVQMYIRQPDAEFHSH